MTAPRDTKQLRVSPEMHAKIMGLAAQLRGTADEALRQLLAPTTVHVPLTPVQHRRWKDEAQAAGVTVPQLVNRCVEASLSRGDSVLIERTYYTVRALAAHHGVNPAAGIPLRTDDPPQ
jgi:hypothetical protein